MGLLSYAPVYLADGYRTWDYFVSEEDAGREGMCHLAFRSPDFLRPNWRSYVKTRHMSNMPEATMDTRDKERGRESERQRERRKGMCDGGEERKRKCARTTNDNFFIV